MRKTRIIVGILFAAATVAVCVFAPRWVHIIVVALLAVISQYEMITAFKSGGYRPMQWPGYAFSLLMVPAIFYGGTELLWNVFLLVIMVSFAVRVLSKTITTRDLLISLIPLLYPLSLFCVMLQAVQLAEPIGRTVLFCGVAFASFTDVFAYFIGSKFGKRKLCPTLSPKKSVEGAVGGFLGGVVCAVGLWLLQFLWHANFAWWIYVGCALLCSFVGQIGDLSASAIKREMGIKDYGNLFPGHGGVLDRFDSILFTVPVAYAFFRIALSV